MRKLLWTVLSVTGLIAAAGCGNASGGPGATTSTPSTSTSASASPSSAGGADYCQQQGGTLQTRQATWGTNNPPAGWVKLAGTVEVCRFQADDEAKSRIYVDLTTLTSAQPTLAAFAYLAKRPLPASAGGANPATINCTALGASSVFGTAGAAGGGWVNTSDPVDVVVNLCVFPDESFIDEWGIAYHAGGVVRGKDLTTTIRYRPGSALPPVFPPSR